MPSFKFEGAGGAIRIDELAKLLPDGTEVEVWGDSVVWVIVPPSAVDFLAGEAQRMPLRAWLELTKAKAELADSG